MIRQRQTFDHLSFNIPDMLACSESTDGSFASTIFNSAENEDSEGAVGKFYLWSKAELMALAGEDGEDGEAIANYYSVSEAVNFGANQNILYRNREEKPGIAPGKLTDLRQNLWKQREKRIHPYKDDKILLGWERTSDCRFGKRSKSVK